MNKTLSAAIALAAVASFASCTSENNAVADFENTQAQTETVTFTTTLPSSVSSRAAESTTYGDGTKATTLYYAVYAVTETEEATTKALVLTNYGKKGDDCYEEDAVTFSNRTATVTMSLATGKTYEVAFWAQSPKATCYSLNTKTGVITVNYTNMLCNDDNVDAFYASTKVTFGSASTAHSVTLHRPFAQLNIGITDAEEALAKGLDVEKSQISIFGVCNELNLLTGAASGFASATYGYNVIPEDQVGAGVFPAKENGNYVDAEYSAMAYIFVASKTTLDIQYNYVDKSGNALSMYDVHYLHNVPFEPNHRTNIYGDMLMADEQTWTIKIDQSFIDPSYDNIYDEGDDVSEDED